MLRETPAGDIGMYREHGLESWSPATVERVAPRPATPPATTLAESALRCRDLADDIGAVGFNLLLVAAQGETRRLVPVFDNAFPGVSAVSKALSAPVADGFARKIATAATPLWWRPVDGSCFLRADARIWADEVKSPLAGTAMAGEPGIVFPVAQENGRAGAVVFHGDDMLLDGTNLCETHARCFGLFVDVARQRPLDSAKQPAMSKREIECLRLTANGFTSEEIAAALGLSVHTANQYLTSSAHKLNAVNRIHAVAKALRAGLID